LSAQDFQDFKVTVLDDGSLDNDAEVYVNSMDDSRFTYLRNATNLGLPMNFQKCVDLATSEWVVIIGQDDRLPADFVSSISRHLDDFTVGFIQAEVKVIDSNGSANTNLVDFVKLVIRKTITRKSKRDKLELARKLAPKAIIPWFLLGNPFYFPAIIWNTKVLKQYGFNTSLPITLDFDLIYRILKDNFPVLFLDKPHTFYRRHNLSVSGNQDKMFERLSEERELLCNYHKLESNPILKIIIFLRLTNRLHALIYSLKSLKNRKLKRAINFFKLFL
jgi:glycosyltransferase involved in cell wall biosynthesis